MRINENELYDSLNKLESIIATSPTEEMIKKYEEMKRNLDDIKMERGKAAITRSQAVWIEEGEKPTKYFLRMVQQRAAQRRIDSLQGDDGSSVYGSRDILLGK